MSIFFIIIILTLAGTTYYLARRLYQGFACFFPKLKFLPILGLVGALALILILGFGRSALPFSTETKQFLGLINSYSMGFFLYLLFYTVLLDLLMLVPRILKLSVSQKPLVKGIMTICVLLLTSITCIFGFTQGTKIHPVSYEIALEGKKDISDLKVVLISDLHLGAVGSEERLENIVDEINAQKPDLICIAGDFFDTDFTSIQNPETAIQTLKKLNATYGTYACLGNHDAGQTYPQMEAFLKEANITLLKESYVVIDDRLVLIGRLDASPIGKFGEEKRQALSSFFTRKDVTLPVIVLDHNPAHIDEYSSEADLILCGHTHKGQVFPGSLLTDILYTVDYGHYQKDATSPHVIVTSGVGYWGMPMRVGTNCEIVSIHFTLSYD